MTARARTGALGAGCGPRRIASGWAGRARSRRSGAGRAELGRLDAWTARGQRQAALAGCGTRVSQLRYLTQGAEQAPPALWFQAGAPRPLHSPHLLKGPLLGRPSQDPYWVARTQPHPGRRASNPQGTPDSRGLDPTDQTPKPLWEGADLPPSPAGPSLVPFKASRGGSVPTHGGRADAHQCLAERHLTVGMVAPCPP